MDAAAIVEAAAEHVLVAAGIETIPATDTFVYLERAAGTHLSRLAPILDADGGNGNGVLTCTNPTPAAPRPATFFHSSARFDPSSQKRGETKPIKAPIKKRKSTSAVPVRTHP